MGICTERVNDLLLAAADMCIPTFTVKKKTNPPWITKEVLNKIKKKKRLWRKLKAHPSEILSRKFKELRRSVKQLVRSEYKRYLEHLSSQLKVLTQNDFGATTQLSRNQNGFLM